MKIKEIRTILTSPGRNYLIVKIVTDNGITGYGDATLNGRELAVKSTIDKYLSVWLQGHDADRIEDIWQLVFRGTYWRSGPVLMTALAGIDMALWDIKGKNFGAPVYSILGGKCRDKLLAYMHVHGKSKETLKNAIKVRANEGCQVVRYSFDTEDPFEKGRYFVQPHQHIEDGQRIEVDESAVGMQNIWDSEVYAKDLVEVTAYLRRELGNSIGLVHDVHERLTPIQAAGVAKELEKYKLFFLEDPVEPMNKEALGLVRSHSTTPLAMGELYNSVYDCMMPIQNKWIDFLRLDISHFGGITPTVKASLLADIYGVKTAFHGPSDISPIAHAATAHINFSIPNFGVQEYVHHGAETDKVFKNALEYKQGYLYIGDTPGLGVEVDEDEAIKHPYQLSFLPSLRDREGAVHNW